MLLWPIFLKAEDEKPETNVNERYTVESIVFSGIEESKISQPLHDEAQKMVGVKYNEKTANDILKKLQDEFPGLNAPYYRILLKVEPGSKPETVKMLFQSVPLVIPVNKLEPNARTNEHSLVEGIEYNGIYESQISQPLHDEAQKMVGRAYNEQTANGILKKLQDELPAINTPYYRIMLRVEQGSRLDTVKVVFQEVTGIFPAKKPETNAKVSERSTLESIVYNGIYESKISRSLHDEAQKMVGMKYNEKTANDILRKLQDEFPELNNEWRRILLKMEKGSKPNTVKVVFQVVVGVFQFEPDVAELYLVESVVYDGIDKSKISQSLRDEAQKMVGTKYNEPTANGIRKKLQEEFPEINNETCRILLIAEQGSKPDTVKVVFRSEINAYECCVVDSIAYNGIYESKISRSLRDEAQKMAGVKYNEHTAKGILKKLQYEFPELNNESHQIILRVQWGNKPGTVKAVFQVIAVIFQPKAPETSVNEGYVVDSIGYPVFYEPKISQALRDEAQKMVGAKYNEHTANGILRKLQEEFPELNNESYRIILNVEKGSKPDTVKVIFQLITSIFQPVNVNERYVVESIVYSGIDESKISQALRNEAQKMAGVKFSEQTANDILKKLQEEFKNHKYEISLKVEKGNNPDKVKIVFQFKKSRLSIGAGAGGVYHSQEGFSGYVGATIKELTFNNAFDFKLVSDANTTLERYTGISASYENKKVGTDKVGLHFDFNSFHEKFNAATNTALTLRPDVPGVYRARENFSPSILLKPFPNKYVGIDLSAGLDFQRLDFQTPASHTQTANAGFANVSLRSCNDQGKYRGCMNITYNLRSASRALGSDFVYTRHSLIVSPSRTQGPHTFSASFSYGWIKGTPPLFERFALGNSYTLRGWNKFEVSPLGGTHEAHGSLEYRYRHFRVFYDVGTEWDENRYSPIRQGLGFGIFQWPTNFLTFSIAFPVGSHNSKPAFGMF
jgi:molybdopterin-biosynthesis enzyme MoeA-like protein